MSLSPQTQLLMCSGLNVLANLRSVNEFIIKVMNFASWYLPEPKWPVVIKDWTEMTSRNKGLNENDQICRKDGLSEKLTSSAHSPVCTQLFLWHMDEHECRRCPNKLRRQCKSLAITAAQCLRIVLLSGCCDVSDEFCNDTLATQWSDSDSD